MVLFQEKQQLGKLWKYIAVALFIIFTVMYFFINHFFVVGIVLSFAFLVFSFQKLMITVYEDRIEYRLFPFHATNRVIKIDSIFEIKKVLPKELGIYGFKVKNTPTVMFYYFGGANIVRIKTGNSRDIIFGIEDLDGLKKVLKF